MGPFLRGFTNELVKVADVRTVIKVAAVGNWGQIAGAGAPTGVVRPPSTAPAGSSFTPPQPNAIPAGGDMLSAIPTQKMESPGKTAPQTWRPSPGYSPSPAGDPTPPPAAPKPAAPARSNVQPPWETATTRIKRIGQEGQYNADLSAGRLGPDPSAQSRGPSSYRARR
jgi:hypothetical protein